MKRFIPLIIIAFIAFSGVLLAQTYPLLTIEEIQYQDPDSLIANGDLPSPYFGDTVRIQGVIMVRPVVDPATDRRRVIAAGGRWATYIQDPNGQVYDFYDGIFPLQEDTTGMNQNTFFDLVDTADVVELTCVVSEFLTSTEVFLLLNPVTPVNVIGNLGQRPAPIELSISDFMNNGVLDLTAEKYEGMYVIIRDVVTSDRNLGTGTFRFNDGQGNYMFMYDQSGYNTLRAHRLTGITDYQPPVDGSTITIRGIVNTRTDGYYIIPLYPDDIMIAASAPSISQLRRDAAEVSSNQSVEISATVIDFDGSVDSVMLFYRVDNGSYTSVLMSSAGNDKYTGTIPGMVSDSALVDYYIWSKDNDANESTMPPNSTSPQFFYLVLNRNVTIQDVQYNPFGTDVSGYNGYYVTLNGVITADTTDFPGTGTTVQQVYMQNGEGPWSGIRIGSTGAMGNNVLTLDKGDDVSITGYIWDVGGAPTFNVTRIDSVTQIVVNSIGNSIPSFQDLETTTIGEGGNGEVEKEQWESVLLRYNDVTVTDENADGPPSNFGEMFVSDGTGDTRVELEDGDHSYHNLSDPTRMYYVQTGHTFDAISGVLYYSFGDYKLVPRNDGDFVGYTTDVDEVRELPTEYSISQNYPNPFNPSTRINYSLPEAGNVTLYIYNLLGQRVKTIFENVPQSAGTHEVVFSAQELPSGIYFYSFKTNNFVQVRKMILMK